MLFEPIGEKAREEVVYEMLIKMEPDEVLSYEDIGRALDLHPINERQAIHAAARVARRKLLKINRRATESVNNIGYRVVHPEEHLRLASGQQRRARKALVRGHDQAVYVDLNGLPPETVKAFELTGRALGALIDYTRRLDTRQKHLEEALAHVSIKVEKSELETRQEIERMKERLARLEGGNPGQA